MSHVVDIFVQGQQYAVRSDLDPAYVTELAAYVDEKMRLVANEITSTDSMRVAMIAALNLADEVFRARRAGSGLETEVLARTEAIERIVDAVLSGAAPSGA